MSTEVASGGLYHGESFIPEQIWDGLYPGGIFKPMLHISGIVFTILASCIASRNPQKKVISTDKAHDAENAILE